MPVGRISAAFAFAACLSLAATMFADEPRNKTDRADRGVQVDTDSAYMFRGTHFIGMNVKNNQGENLGSIEDLVMDFECHHVRYAAISFGGVLGFGNKFFAVPLSALALRYDSSADKPYILYDVTQERLKESPGFDMDHWPDMADAAWSKDIDKFYGVTFEDVTIGVAVEGRKNEARDHKHHHVMRCSHLKGMNLRNTKNADLGSISDYVFNAKSGFVTHLVVSHGGVAGVGGDQYVIPMSQFTVKDNIADNKRMLVMNVDLQRFKDGPRIGDEWPNFNEKDWSQRFDRYYEKREAKTF